METILITGASGSLGSRLAAAAHGRGRHVVGLYHRHLVSTPGMKSLRADLTDGIEICRIFGETQPTSVIHCAAATNVDWCQEHQAEAARINTAAVSAIADVTSRNGIRLLHVSTDSVFDGEGSSYLETAVATPVNFYAKTKLLAENEVLRRDPQAAVARVNFYGWGSEKESLAEWVLKRLSKRLPVPGFSDVLFCPMLSDDLADILLALLDRYLSGIYHVVVCEPISKYEFARRVASSFGFDPAAVVATPLARAALKAARPRNTTLNTDKICAALGRSMPSVQDGLCKFLKLREVAAGI